VSTASSLTGETFKFSTYPELVAKVTGLFLWVSNSFLGAPLLCSGLVQMVEAGSVASWRCQHEK
jgi:hypothetical protein